VLPHVALTPFPQFTVPLLLDSVTRRIVCNESALIMQDFNAAFDSFARFPAVNLRPPHVADAIEILNNEMCPAVHCAPLFISHTLPAALCHLH
jgi:glutathionyl-hydroquinone reductase